jgi:hypothetical protein
MPVADESVNEPGFFCLTKEFVSPFEEGNVVDVREAIILSPAFLLGA